MLRAAILAWVGSAIFVVAATAGGFGPPGDPGGGEGADDPLALWNGALGNVGVTATALAYSGVANPSGTFTVSGVPNDAEVLLASLYLTDWETEGQVAGEFAGVPLHPSYAVRTDPGGGLLLGSYVFDVTDQVTGNGSYQYSSEGITRTYGSALVVMYSGESLKDNSIQVFLGAESMCCGATATARFDSIRRKGKGRLIVFTTADDAQATGEVITFNGKKVGGPLDANLGPHASLLDIPLKSKKRGAVATLTTPEDWLGWHLAVFSGKNQ
jgi:hypothetical protein